MLFKKTQSILYLFCILFGMQLWAQENPGEVVCEEAVWDLTAGQTMVVGTVTVSNDADNLYVKYSLNDNYPDASLGTLHVWVGDDLTNMPANPQGIPVPGQFPYSATANDREYTFVIPLDEIGVTLTCPLSLFVVPHAEVTLHPEDPEHETAFGGPNPGEGPRWWFYGEYEVCCEEPPVEPKECETAFAKGGYVFTTSPKANPESLPTLELTRNRWGWAINLQSPTIMSASYPIYAGAGLNNTAKGTHVGNLTVDWDGSLLKVTYELYFGYVMEEVHIYVGDTPPTTIAPGQYGYTEYFDPATDMHMASFIVEDSDEDGIWIIAHTVVCEDEID